MSKDDLLKNNPEREEEPETLDLESDDREASDLLEIIERDTDAKKPDPETLGPVKAKKEQESPAALEWHYLRSFAERPLLTRDAELTLAKQIDRGTRGVRKALREAVRVAGGMRKAEPVQEWIGSLDEIRKLSGLSATALDRAEFMLKSLIAEARSQGKLTRSRQLARSHREVQQSRITLETGKDELVQRNLRLVVDIAKHYNGRGLSLLDLVQEGNIGLMKAAERYQHRKGFKFSTYATWWIRQGITRALADQSRTIRIPVHMTEASHRIMRTSRRLAQQLGREPRADDIGRELRLRPSKIHETMQVFQEPVSLENPVGDGETVLGEFIADRNAVSPEAHVHRTDLNQELDRILGTLTPREQVVIRMRFGIGQDEPYTLEQVGQSLSVTRERIRQIEAKALKKLKAPGIKEMFAAIR
jgi:RNA polymerase primary sigma factor